MSVRIPETIAAFNAYINTTDTFLQAISSGVITNWERLGMIEENADEWHTRRLFWSSDLYVKYTDPVQSTSIIKTNVQTFIANFRAFGNPQLNIMAASLNATETDEAVFNFIITPDAPTQPTAALTETVLFETEHLNGSDLRFTCTTATDATRASKPEGADSVQLAYLILTPAQPGPNPDPEGGPDLPGADSEELTREIFTKAIFIKHFGTQHLTKRVIVYARWYNTKHPLLAGPWSDIRVIVIA